MRLDGPVLMTQSRTHWYVMQVIEAPLPKPPTEIAVLQHWLAIDGVQPAIPENTPLQRPNKRPRLAPTAAATPGEHLQQDGAPLCLKALCMPCGSCKLGVRSMPAFHLVQAFWMLFWNCTEYCTVTLAVTVTVTVTLALLGFAACEQPHANLNPSS